MTFWRNYYHLTWATKQRLPLIQAKFEKQLYGYLVKKAGELDVSIYAINGTEDHMHILAAIPPKHSVANVVKHLKGASSHYVNHVIRSEGHFEWQRGYGCLTVGEKQRSIAEKYVHNQKKHHAEHNTNIWLEHLSEGDEGPVDMGPPSDEIERFASEEAGDYDVLGELPF